MSERRRRGEEFVARVLRRKDHLAYYTYPIECLTEQKEEMSINFDSV